MFLDVQGEREVLAGDISPAAEYEVANPDLHLATMDSEEAALSIEFNVERGRGYMAAANIDGLPIGALPVDAIFTPVRKVNFKVEPIRIGPYMGKERVLLDTWTDGTIRPVQALQEAGDALINYFSLFANLGKSLGSSDGRLLNVPPEHYAMSLESLQLPARIFNCLNREGLNSVGEVLERGEEELLKIRNFGEKSLSELYEVLIDHGVDVESILAGAIQAAAAQNIEAPQEAVEEPPIDENEAEEEPE